MAKVAISASLTGAKGIFKDVRKRVSKPLAGRARKPAAQALRDSVLRDFSRGGHHGPSGGFTPWPAAKSFGDCEPSSRTLGGTGGSIGLAWAKAREIPSANGVAIIAEHPGMRAHLEGALIKAKKRTASGKLAMQVFLGMKCGVWIGEAKLLSGLEIPARPFASKNPDLARDLERIVVEAILAR